MVGLPGCGKDLTKKIASSVLGKSLLDLDFGSVMGEGGGVIGSSAMTIKRALSIATTLKGILGISEFEKAVGGLESSSRTDGGETARAIAYLLNWMQEQSEVFVIGTANDVRGLAAEQTRQGRFSHIVFVDLPTLDERREIFAVHLRKRNREPEEFDLDELAEATEGYSGAEIEAAVDELDRSRALDGRFIPKLRAAYNERVVAKVAARLRGTIHRAVEGGVVKIMVRF
jgi:SpoVK/Ycf46/Vps4 family AAA+-type ATPase